MVKILFKLIGIILGLIVAFTLLHWAFILLGLLAQLFIGIVLLFGMVYLIRFLFGIGSGTPKAAVKYTLANYKQPAVALFANEPSVTELINLENGLQQAEWTIGGSVIEVDNNTEVIILEDTSAKQAVRVKVSQGKYKGRDGWVCRSSLHENADRLLPG